MNHKAVCRWTQAHFRWMEGLRFDVAVQQIAFQEYLEALMALRGVKLITAMTIMAELGDITRFDSPAN